MVQGLLMVADAGHTLTNTVCKSFLQNNKTINRKDTCQDMIRPPFPHQKFIPLIGCMPLALEVHPTARISDSDRLNTLNFLHDGEWILREFMTRYDHYGRAF
ncbi:hypothetical protein C5167_043481 [Papaver somniferum]|uniref:Uncharacterized protein n=1 Tax=Papaver somniferum TaxID=3469 RepID=A0A4Y7L5Q9_PAPSO|nr:hypothetical protein C5167_043481 [Papaver somniferum]